jgi:hypothetical protein
MNRYFIPLCQECGDPLVIPVIFKDYDGNNFCSSGCKWVHVYREDCSAHGKRPAIPGSWFWASFQCFQRDGFKCQKCGSKTDLEAHHRIPISKGGNSLPENLITFCHSCHMKPGMHRGTRNTCFARSKKIDPTLQGVLSG